ncbi:hypothetical protein CAPN002_25480 [Capnocytophaga stomatis]|uniref:Uncharacterized protein n=1 Tax=Capnocytophaga stomatis TaxID=1848904 RepID=A0A250G1X8_9FLAO|nr:hypothetical protein CGC58_11230 [Capnocytophaga stomatis]GIJ95330.1 hypothetical protein CAPN002_25480 [Capnocytophaga stomatis]
MINTKKPLFIPLSIICFSFIISFVIEQNILKINNSNFHKVIVTINNIASIISPLLTLILSFLSSKYIINYYKLGTVINSKELIQIICKSLFPVAFILLIILIIIVCNIHKLDYSKDVEEFNSKEIFYNLNIIDLKFIHDVSWILFYTLFVIALTERNIPLVKSFVIVIVPVLLFLLFKISI